MKPTGKRGTPQNDAQGLDAEMARLIELYESVSPGTLEAMAKAEAED